jgi:HlyD family secretion protein
MKKFIVFLIILAALGTGGWAYYANKNRPEPTVTTLPISRGDVAEVVQATGTLEAVTTVSVGTQVSGVVQDLFADFNNIVHKGQVIAKLDPSVLEVQIVSQKANVERARADLERLKVAQTDAQVKYDRAKAMFAKELVPKTDLETAEINVKSAVAQIKSAEASLLQSEAALNQAQVNLSYTVIKSPIDGIVIQRSVEPGQTVASSMNAPTLYVLAADLSKMQVLANIDEAEIGRMRPGQVVTFRVDAYPGETFNGSVEQVRLQPTTVQNVVVYSTVISVPNPDLKLKPGMTANVNVEVARRTNVLRVPAAALRFRPTELMFTALNQPVPPEARPGGGRGGFGNRGGQGGGRNGQTAGGGQPGAGGGQATAGQTAAAPQPGRASGAAPAATPQGNKPAAGAPPAPQMARQGGNPSGAPPSAEARGGGDPSAPGAGGGGFGGGRGGGRTFDPNMTPEERQKRMQERLAQMTPEQRQQFEARMKERGGFGNGGQGGGQGGRGAGPGGGQNAQNAPGGSQQGQNRRDVSRGMVANTSAGTAVASGHNSIDSLFAPIQIAQTPGRVWLYADKQLKSIRVRTGVTDGTFTELVDGEVTEGQEVVVNMVTGLEPKTNTPGQQGTGNPLMGPQRGGPGGPGGGRGGGGGGRGF